ncbi:MAG: PepSY-like domain-containing protein [Bacteroidales bacterium]|nr:PepSY-like domain-containing protein [Bacteroidales bacterium]
MDMKKTILILVSVFFFAVSVFAEKPIDFSQLPKTAQEFVNTYFAKAKVSAVLLDDDGDYEVKLDNGVEIDFNSLGSWMEISGHVALPKGILSSNIYNYISANYKKSAIHEVERDKNGFEVKLSNGIELLFDLNGNFVRVDD